MARQTPSPQPVQLVNLTERDVAVDLLAVDDSDARATSGSPSTATGNSSRRRGACPPTAVLPPDGGLARVVEPRLGVAVIATTAGRVREVRLRRSEDVAGLPPPRDGVLYLVPRLTAAAARQRSDLVFPFEQIRGPDGQVTGARALGRFDSEPRRRRLRDAVHQRWRDVPTLTRWTGVLVAVATAFLGGALGVVPDLTAGADEPDFRTRLVTFAVILLTGILALWAGIQWWRRREQLLHKRGTAYVLDEIAEAWTYEEKRSFITALSSHFAAVLQVPGPAELGDAWRWPLGPGAERWGQKVDDLVRAFWAVHYNDDQETHNALFVWAWWSVAVAFGARATAGRRRVTLRVRQRPTSGREGQLGDEVWRNEPHVFTRDPGLPTLGQEMPPRVVSLTVTAQPQLSREQPSAPPEDGQAEPTLLLVRLIRQVWGDDLRPDTPLDVPLTLTIDDAAGIGFTGTAQIRCLEWQHLAPIGTLHPWADYPALAQSATSWMAQTACSLSGPVLVGMLVPPEVGVGMGVLIGATPHDQWPTHLWPVQVQPCDGRQRLVIPGLDLGWAGVHKNGR